MSSSRYRYNESGPSQETMKSHKLWKPSTESRTGYDTDRPRQKSSRTVTQPDPRTTTKTDSRQQRGYASDTNQPSSSRAPPPSTHYNTVPSTSKSSRHHQQPSSSSQYPVTSSHKATTSYATQPTSVNATSQPQRYADPSQDTRLYSSRQPSDRAPVADGQAKSSRYRSQAVPSASHTISAPGEPPATSLLLSKDAPRPSRTQKDSAVERPKEVPRERDRYAEARYADEQARQERQKERERDLKREKEKEREREERYEEERRRARAQRRKEREDRHRLEEEQKAQQEQKAREDAYAATQVNYGRDRARERPYDPTEPTLVAVTSSARSREPEDSDNSPRRKANSRQKHRHDQSAVPPSNVCHLGNTFNNLIRLFNIVFDRVMLILISTSEQRSPLNPSHLNRPM